MKKKMTKKELADKLHQLELTANSDNYVAGSEWQQNHARLAERYVVTYPNSILTDDETAALIFALNQDIQVRDYALGLNRASDKHYQAWYTLMNRAPQKYKSAQACLASVVRFEQNLKAEAMMVLTNANNTYPLNQLLSRVYAAGWEPKSFASMRAELHPLVTAGIFKGVK